MHTRRLLLEALIALLLTGCTPAEAKQFTTVVHTVTVNDTMDSIAQAYLPSDRGNSHQAFAEFKEGIFEYNYDRVFVNRKPYEIHVGDELLITFWK